MPVLPTFTFFSSKLWREPSTHSLLGKRREFLKILGYRLSWTFSSSGEHWNDSATAPPVCKHVYNDIKETNRKNQLGMRAYKVHSRAFSQTQTKKFQTRAHKRIGAVKCLPCVRTKKLCGPFHGLFWNNQATREVTIEWESDRWLALKVW